MIGISILVYLFGLDGRIGRLEGALLFAGIIAYTLFLIRQSRKESKEIEQEYAKEFGDGPITGARQYIINIVLVLAGLALLILGARWLVESAVSLARALGLAADHWANYRRRRYVDAQGCHLRCSRRTRRAGYRRRQRRGQQYLQYSGRTGLEQSAGAQRHPRRCTRHGF